jgi:acetoin utilization deacetylase AcuC-like enzyme
MQLPDTVLFYDPIFEEHKTGYGHPERPERLPVALEALKDSGLLEAVGVISPREATTGEIEFVHTPQYVEKVERVADSGGGQLDMDTALSAQSYAAALKAAGALLQSVDGCLQGDFERSFCLVRPPGHHALPDRGMGFCLFNNVAIAARYATTRKDVERVLIVDWDAHHGNGTQDIFYEDPAVLYVSLHQHPHYPGTGSVGETGHGKGEGYTMNFPFPPGTGEDEYLEAFRRVILPAAREFDPRFIMVSAGYDSHGGDLLCSMRLNDTSYRKMADLLCGFADDCCNGRLIATLEGGYNLDAQANSIVQTVAAMAGIDVPGEDEPPQPTVYTEKAGGVIDGAARLHGL